MTTIKQRKIRVLLDDKDNLDALYVLQRYVENIERIIDSVRCLII